MTEKPLDRPITLHSEGCVESWRNIRQVTKDNPGRGLDSRSSERKLEMCLGVREEGERYRRRQLSF